MLILDEGPGKTQGRDGRRQSSAIWLLPLARSSRLTGFTRRSGSRGRFWRRSADRLQKAPSQPGGHTGHCSRGIPQISFPLSFSRRSHRWKATAIHSPAPTGAGSGRGTLLKSIALHRARSACFKLPMQPSPRPRSTASGIIKWPRGGHGTTFNPVGSIGGTHEPCPAIPLK